MIRKARVLAAVNHPLADRTPSTFDAPMEIILAMYDTAAPYKSPPP